MPSPVGHALAGTVVALSAGSLVPPELRRRTVVATCIALAVLPDLDLLYQPVHRAFTHSVGAAITVLFISIAIAVTVGVTRRTAVVFGLVCASAWASHLLLDWLGTDPSPPRGLRLLWPFSDQWFISGLDLFLGTERRHPFTVASMIQNLRAITREVLVLAPIVLLLLFANRGWLVGEDRQGREAQDAGQA